jgi:hypothetical protein
MAPRAGRRQPPVGNIRRCESETHIAGDMSRMQPGAGGRQPPWETSAVTDRKRTPQAICRACNRERGASAPRRVQSVSERETRKVIAWQSQTRFGKPRRAHAAPLLIARSTDSEHCSIFIRNRSRHTPRRADARHSCERAFVHRKNRFFAGDRTPCMAPRARGVSPPWETSAVANRKRTPQATCRACNQERGASAPRGAQAFSSGLECAALQLHFVPTAG